MRVIDTAPVRDAAYEAAHPPGLLTWKTPVGYRATAGSLQVRFETLGVDDGGIRISKGNTEVTLIPQVTFPVVPELRRSPGGDAYVVYANAFPGADLLYAYTGSGVKEHIRINSAAAPARYAFALEGARVDIDARGGATLTGDAGDVLNLGDLSVDVTGAGPTSERRVRYTTSADRRVLALELDAPWLARLPASRFPVVVDPTIWDRTTIPGGDYGQFIPYKSDGYQCNSTNCNINVGALNDHGLKAWRTMMRIPYEHTQGRQLLYAQLGMDMVDNSGNWGWPGYYDGRTIWVTWAPCFGYGCTNGGAPVIAGVMGSGIDLNVTPLIQWLDDNPGANGGWLIVWGEEWHATSYKNIRGASAELITATNIVPTAPSPKAPSTNPNAQTLVTTTTPQLEINSSSDGNGDPLTYQFELRGANGSVWNSGFYASRQWIVPDGVLQDDSAYTWWVSVKDESHTSAPYRMGGLRVDLRTDRDKTQTVAEVGPLGVSLGTGNGDTSIATHDLTALGGGIGLKLHYSNPLMSRMGLVAEYFNNTTRSGLPAYRRVEPSIAVDWDTGTPVPGVINVDGFSVRWSGFFVAPYTGDFTFGAANDDDMALELDGNPMFAVGCCRPGDPLGSPIHLTAGQTVPLTVTMAEYGGPGRAYLMVKSDTEPTLRAVPTSWLRTPPLPVERSTGLTGHYYHFTGDLPPDLNALTDKFLVRTDPAINFSWGPEAPAPAAPADRFAIRFTGFFTAPATGAYRFGVGSDDGIRLSVNNTQLLDRWVPRGYTEDWSGVVDLTAGQSVPIRLEYYEATGGAALNLMMDGPAGRGIIESKYLTPGTRVLPAGWRMSTDADGDLEFERLAARQSGDVVLTEGDGTERLFTWTGSGFKPPVNETAVLVKNADGTYNVTDSGGRIYLFGVDGVLRSTSTPTDDRKPAALRYEYAVINGMPKLQRIVDGVTDKRWGSLYYGGDGRCPPVPGGFDAAPAQELCAFATSDGLQTNLFYRAEHLVRIELPGGARTDYGTDANGTIVRVRDILASDLVTAGRRADDDGVDVVAAYDGLGRVARITPPAATAGSVRPAHRMEYLAAATKRHVDGAPEPSGYTQYVEFDEKWRTTKACDVDGQCTSTTWDAERDLELASTDSRGLMQTSFYDGDDRPTEKFGPAPKTWFGADRRPLLEHTSKVPTEETRYDESIPGLAAAYQDYRLPAGQMAGLLFGAPRTHATGLPGRADGAIAQSWSEPPMTIDPAMNGWGVSLTGKIRIADAGATRFKLTSDDGVKLWIDDTLVVDDWIDGATRDHTAGTFTNPMAGSLHRIRLDHYDRGGDGQLTMAVAQAGGEFTTDLGGSLTPQYGLVTSKIVRDGELGNEITKTVYSDPARGQVGQEIEDPGGLALTTRSTYEPQGTGFARMVSKTSPAGTATAYGHWAGDAVADNPCTPAVESIPQAGLQRTRVDPDPDGAGPRSARSSETIYDASGTAAASRVSGAPWTCFERDLRGRLTQTKTPANGSRPGQTILNNHAYVGDPLTLRTVDASGTIIIRKDLLGQVVYYKDALGHITTSRYNALGQRVEVRGPRGVQTFTYDDYGHETAETVGGKVVARPVWDEEGDLVRVNVPIVPGVKVDIVRDELAREVERTNTLPASQPPGYANTVTERVERSQSGDVVRVKLNGASLSGDAPAYGYDGARRMTRAEVAGNVYGYGFGPADGGCKTGPGNNPLAGANGNRTSMTNNGVRNRFCYNAADQLVSSTASAVAKAEYDAEGNTLLLGTTSFTYDASGRNARINGPSRVDYVRDMQNRIMRHDLTEQVTAPDGTTAPRTTTTFYGYSEPGDSPDVLLDADQKVLEQYVELPGGVTLTLRPLAATDPRRAQLLLPNQHGDVLTALDANGRMTMPLTLYDPFGGLVRPGSAFLTANPALAKMLNRGSQPDTRGDSAEAGYLGSKHRFSESAIPALLPMQMGARIYIPRVGRFLAVDSVEGGTDNAYAYPNDPTNDYDLDGTWGMPSWAKSAKTWAQNHQDLITTSLTFGVCVATGAVACAVVGGLVAGAVAVQKIRQDRSRNVSWGAAIAHGSGSFLLDMAGSKKIKILRQVRYFGKSREYKSAWTALRKAPGRQRLAWNSGTALTRHYVGRAYEWAWNRRGRR